MVGGKLLAVGSEFAWLFWLDDKQRSWIKRGKRLEKSFWNPKGLRAYRCKECRVIICYEKEKVEPLGTPKSFLKKCIKCGEEIPIATEHCPKCGAKQKEKKR